jgi:serine/threonine-protein kinase
MEYLEGNDLSRVLKARGALPVAEVVEHLVQACDAIAVAHSLGVIHRDLKPANLFLTRRVDGSTSLKVLDFGIAKAFDAPEANELTSATTMIGSPLYMSPEQMANASDVDARADIWSLGVIAYRLLTTKLPFTGENVVELAMNIASRPPRPLRELRPDLSPMLEMAIMKCLERDKDARWPDVGAFVQTIAPYGPSHLQPTVHRVLRVTRPNGDSQPPFAPVSGDHELLARSATSPTLSAPSATSLPPPAEEAPAKRRGGLLVALFLLVVAAAGAGVLVAKQRVAPSAASPAPPASEAKAPPPSASPSVAPVASVEVLSPPPSASVSAEKPKPLPAGTIKSVVQKPAAKPSASSKDVWGWE